MFLLALIRLRSCFFLLKDMCLQLLQNQSKKCIYFFFFFLLSAHILYILPAYHEKKFSELCTSQTRSVILNSNVIQMAVPAPLTLTATFTHCTYPAAIFGCFIITKPTPEGGLPPLFNKSFGAEPTSMCWTAFTHAIMGTDILKELLFCFNMSWEKVDDIVLFDTHWKQRPGP